MGETLFRKVWDAHTVRRLPNGQTQLFVGLHLIHEVTSPQAFDMLRARGWEVRYPHRTFATVDHIVPTRDQRRPFGDALAEEMLRALERNCREHGIALFDLASGRQGIVHVIGPELGITQPGMTIVCGDSHTATHGAFGALAFGVGTSEVSHVLATQCLLQRRPKTFAINVEGELGVGVTAKDIILAIIRQIGVSGGVGHVFEYRGSTIRRLTMEQRMTICNMSIEGGARAGMIAPDETTFAYLKGRPFAPQGAAWEQAVARWRTLTTDEGAVFDRETTLHVDHLAPMVTYGTNPGMGLTIEERIPRPEEMASAEERRALEKALAYMGLRAGQPIAGQPIDYVFIGSCTNSRIEDLRQAAAVVKGRRVADEVVALVVPGSKAVKAQAEAEGLDRIFREAGWEWRGAGCSMCLAMNDDKVPAGKYCASTSNRNFEGRQGKGARTFLMSPLMAAAAALRGKIVDVREFL